MSSEPPSALIGLLIDVSGSMQETFETESLDDPGDASSRLHAAFRAALNCAIAEQHHDPDAHVFVGIFGLKTRDDDDGETTDEKGAGCPSMIDLCAVANALLGDGSERPSGHSLLIERANRENVPHIARYIREKLTGDEARILDEYLSRHPSEVQRFLDAIPPEEYTRRARFLGRAGGGGLGLSTLGALGGSVAGPIGGLCGAAVGARVGDSLGQKAVDMAEDAAGDNSEALRLARAVCATWLRGFVDFRPRPVQDVVRILDLLQRRSGNQTQQDEANDSPAVDTLKRYIYGRTPMRSALKRSLGVFRAHSEFKHRVLLLLSDGRFTDGDPTPVAHELHQENVTTATAYLTGDREVAHRQLYYEPAAEWNTGQVTLFSMATRLSGARFPIPVLASMGWKVPSQGQIGLFAIASTSEALDGFCSMALSVRFTTAEILLDMVGRVSQDKYINDEHVRTCDNPADQGQSETCYAHATAGAIHMALVRIVGREGGVPEIREIRDRILALCPAGVLNMAHVLKEAVKWYRPLRFHQVDEDGARQAILRRRKVLVSFHLSQAGWRKFSQHYKAIPASALTRRQMEPYRSQGPGGGHAVIMTGCDPESLTFLNSWGKKWGNNGSFSVENHTVLGLEGPSEVYPMRFYDVYWFEKDLTTGERQAFAAKANGELRIQVDRYPSLQHLALRCPHCRTSAPLVNFRGTIREAVCPNCHEVFAPEPRYLLDAL